MRRLIVTVFAVLTAAVINAQDLTVLHFNDTHSHIDPQRSGENKGQGGVVEHAAYIDSVRMVDGRKNVLLLHAGDFGQGTSYFTELGGNIEIDVLNALKFDVVCLGNHEFDNGVEELARRLKNLDADVVCANYDFTGSPLADVVKPYVILRRGGMKIGILGVLTDIMSVVSREIAESFTYQDPVAVVNSYASYLAEEKGCDLVICLSHLGNWGDLKIAEQIRNVDVIIGGHSHTLIEDIQTVKDLDGKDVVIVQDWKWGLRVGNLKIKK
ncbi:MAG: metallophosphoesterase [Bacteroidales bacterium]|nr:metallophosphoesterase [Bacteroidales bacterium]